MSTPEQRAYQRAYYLANKAAIIARTGRRSRKWHKENKERAAEINRSYRQQNADALAERKRARRATETVQEQEKAYAKDYHGKNAEKRNLSSREWHSKNHKKVAKRHKRWREENSHKKAESDRRRTAIRLRAFPEWANLEKIEAIYAEAARLTKATGIQHEVDHIYPLQSKVGCGLHVETNLQILTKKANATKSNKWPAMACDGS